MKKNTSLRKLTLKLRKESLRPLSPTSLTSVAGGGVVDPSVRVAGCDILSRVQQNCL